MPMTSCNVSADGSAAVVGVYPPQGVTGNLSNFRVTQAAEDAISPLTFGTGTGQVNLITCSDRTLAAGASGTYDLFTGTDLKDLIGETCAFRKVKYLKVSIVSGGDASGVRIGGAATNEWVGFFAAAGDKKLIFAGGPAEEAGSPAGVAVGTSTKNLLIENLSAVSVTVRILLAGTNV